VGAILFVDDHHAFRTVFAEILRSAGYTVLEAGTPSEAERLLERHGGKAGVLVVEAVLLMAANGLEIARRIQQSHPGMRTLFVSEEPAETLRREGLLPEEAHYLRKPFEARQFLEAVCELASEQSEREPQGATRRQKSSAAPKRATRVAKSHKTG
jgi:DNA-binding response OmpR family regulator